METEGEDYVGAVIDGTRPICEMWGAESFRMKMKETQSFRSCLRKWEYRM